MSKGAVKINPGDIIYYCREERAVKPVDVSSLEYMYVTLRQQDGKEITARTGASISSAKAQIGGMAKRALTMGFSGSTNGPVMGDTIRSGDALRVHAIWTDDLVTAVTPGGTIALFSYALDLTTKRLNPNGKKAAELPADEIEPAT